MRADTGPIGGDLSHEFIILAATGESEVFCDSDCLDLRHAGRRHRFRRASRPAGRSSTSGRASMPPPRRCTTRPPSTPCPTERRLSARGIEVGHIFYFGTKYSEPMGAVVDRPGRRGACRCTWAPTASARRRLVAALIEAGHDEAGIIWPDAVAPFEVGRAQPQGRRRRHRRRLRAALPRARRRGRRRALRRPRRAAGRASSPPPI